MLARAASSRFLSDMLKRIAGSGRQRSLVSDEENLDVVGACRRLLDDHGEASGLVTAKRILDRLEALTPEARRQVWEQIAEDFGPDETALKQAIAAWSSGDVVAARRLHFSAEPRSQALIRTLNRVPGATARLVKLRAELLGLRDSSAQLRGLDLDFRHLFLSWFNRGFLEIQHIDWMTSAAVLEKIIRYEAVHEIKGWDDLRQRVGAPDRRLFAFFHPAMPDEPLIFVEVALTAETPGAIAPILAGERQILDPERATTAVFYSISNCQKGLRGISFGSFLIKQVVEELSRELPGLKRFVTLSPVPGLRSWALAQNEEPDGLSAGNRALIEALEAGQTLDEGQQQGLRRMAAHYLLEARRSQGQAQDPVAHFHLGNGAELEAIHLDGDLSPSGQNNAWGVMVNYHYDGEQIEGRHQAYANAHHVAAKPALHALAKEFSAA